LTINHRPTGHGQTKNVKMGVPAPPSALEGTTFTKQEIALEMDKYGNHFMSA